MTNFVTIIIVQVTELINCYTILGKAIGNIPETVKEQAKINNGWFVPDFVDLAGKNWEKALTVDKIEKWLSMHDFQISDKKVGIIMAGNIPFVGLHDLLSVLAKGMIAVVKLSSNDEVLMKYAISTLCSACPFLENRILIEGRLNSIDYLIATGSNNSSRYFEYYFKGIPSLIRKNRTSIAILNGHESDETLKLLASDIYTYFGLGCRNVSHLLLPRNIELKRLYEAYDVYMDHVHHHKYYNNYMYHKSILLMNLDKHYDNGFMLFQEKESLHAPIATLNYHFYDNLEEVNKFIESNADEIQAVISDIPEISNAIKLGHSQVPELWEYADNVNVLSFLSN